MLIIETFINLQSHRVAAMMKFTARLSMPKELLYRRQKERALFNQIVKMARPKRNNADYFSHDADMRNDLKIKALRSKFGNEGYALWCMVLEVLTDRDYFEYEWSEIMIEIMAADFGIKSKQLVEFIDYCIKLKLIEHSEGYIYSLKHQERFAGLLSKRDRERSRVFNGDNTTIKGVIAGDNPSISGDNTQSKVKESKVKESKVNNTSSVSEKTSFSANEAPIVFSNEQKEGLEESQVVLKNGKKQEPKIDYSKIVELYHGCCPSYPIIFKLTDARKAKLQIRFEEMGFDYAILKQMFEKLEASKYCKGDNPRGWKASFDWVIENSKNWVKVIEGNYDNNQPGAPAFKKPISQPVAAATKSDSDYNASF